MNHTVTSQSLSQKSTARRWDPWGLFPTCTHTRCGLRSRLRALIESTQPITCKQGYSIWPNPASYLRDWLYPVNCQAEVISRKMRTAADEALDEGLPHLPVRLAPAAKRHEKDKRDDDRVNRIFPSAEEQPSPTGSFESLKSAGTENRAHQPETI